MVYIYLCIRTCIHLYLVVIVVCCELNGVQDQGKERVMEDAMTISLWSLRRKILSVNM